MAENGDTNLSQRPLQGVIMCCTSIPPDRRSELATLASQMGAAHKLDLTSDVTHLIVGDTDTPKYKYVAKERPDVRVLRPEWVEAVRSVWLEGGETDVAALELRYRLPTFAGLKICVTGFEDHVVRKKLEETVKGNGGEYRGDLNKEVTHLIAHKPTGQKYVYAKSWGIHIISIEWLQQSLERGMILDEQLYDPLMEPTERGRDAWVRRTASIASLAKRARDDEVAPAPARKLRRTASARFSSQNQDIWTDIVGGGFGQEGSKKNEWDDQQDSLSTVKPDSDDRTPPEPVSLESDKASRATRPDSEGGLQLSRSTETETLKPQGLFYGKRFYLHGFDAKKTAILQGHLQSHNAEILPGIMQLSQASTPARNDPGYILVPHTSSERDIPSTPDPDSQPTVVTDMWIERCLHKKAFVNPKDNVTNSPFQFPVPGFDRLIISSTAFEGIDLLQLSKAVKLMGATYDESLTPQVSVLVCNSASPNRDKIRMALEWNVPAVSAEWLWESLRSGRRKSFNSYLIQIASQAITGQTGSRRASANSKQAHEETNRNVPTTMKHSTKQPRKPVVDRNNQQAVGSRHTDSGKQSISSRSVDLEPSFEKDSFEALDTENKQPRRSMRIPTKQSEPDKDTVLQHEPPEPLQERSPNSPPKAQTKDCRTSAEIQKESVGARQDSITPQITSLIAHYQQQTTIVPPVRKKRRILGRADSTLSHRSAGSITRASSVDTLNTDGVGTPLELVHPTGNKTETKGVLTASLLAHHDEQAEADEAARQKLQMTQLGYEDSESDALREILARKMNGEPELGKVKVGTPKMKGQGIVRDLVGTGVQSVSKRTRQAGAR